MSQVKTVSTPIATYYTAALEAANKAINNTLSAKGHSVRFAAAVLRLAAIGTEAAKAKGEELAKAVEEIAGGKGYASNARRVFAADTKAVKTVLAFYEDAGNGGFKSLSNVFAKHAEAFPTTSNKGRAARAAVPEGVSMSTPEGWKLALNAIVAGAPGLKGWALDDINAARDSANCILALIQRNAK